MKLAIGIIKSEIAQRKLANSLQNLRKQEIAGEIKSLEKALFVLLKTEELK